MGVGAAVLVSAPLRDGASRLIGKGIELAGIGSGKPRNRRAPGRELAMRGAPVANGAFGEQGMDTVPKSRKLRVGRRGAGAETEPVGDGLVVTKDANGQAKEARGCGKH